jgi:HlyD family secretion protein
MKKKLLRILVLVVLLAVVAGVLLSNRRNPAAEANNFFTTPAALGPLKKVVSATGVVQTVLTVQVGSQVSGQVEELYADFNSVVKRGQLLAKLDTRNLDAQVANSKASVAAAQARVKSAQADIKTHAANLQNSKASLDGARVARANAELQFQRAKELSQRGVASKNDYDTAQLNFETADSRYEQAKASLEQVEAQDAQIDAAVEQAKAVLQQANADLERAEINLGYANIFSPVDGVVISRSVDVGQTIAASLQSPTLFTIATDLGRMQVSASVDEADIGNISEGATVTFTVDAYPNDVFVGKIAEIRLSPQTVQNVVTYSVILAIDNPGNKLKPGMTANISVTVAERPNVLKVPNAALRYSPPNAENIGDPSAPAAPSRGGARGGAEKEAAAGRTTDRASLPLAPGQKWDPGDKIRFATSSQTASRPGIVWVLNEARQPQLRKVMVGITDGASTEIASGDLHSGDLVIIGDSTQAENRGGFSFFGGRGR